MTEILDADLLVIGGGMGGMTAAAWAADHGAHVIVVEKAAEIGGSAVLSGGGLWTAADVATMHRVNPYGDPGLGALVVNSWIEVGDWIESTGAEIGPRLEVDAEKGFFGFAARKRAFDPLGYVRRCRTIVEAAGGTVVAQATVRNLVTENGAVTGALVADREGVAEIRAPHTVLATGGFQGDRELRRELIGEFTADILVRSNPCSTGDGLRLGQAAGGSLTPHLDGWYGHTVPFPLPGGLEPKDYIRFAQFNLSPRGILLDRDGKRFIDETEGYYKNAQATARQPDQRALLVFDEDAHEADTGNTGSTGTPGDQIDRPRDAAAAGAHVAVAGSWAELEAQVAAWGYREVAATVTEFNRSLAEDGQLEPGRRRYRRPLSRAPFYAIEIQPAITFTHGGLRVDDHARVLDGGGRPIPGLLAAGADGAGTYHVNYAGGLAMSGALGIAAARTAVAVPRTG